MTIILSKQHGLVVTQEPSADYLARINSGVQLSPPFGKARKSASLAAKQEPL